MTFPRETSGSDAAAVPTVTRGHGRDSFVLLVKGGCLLVIACLTVTALAWFVPEGNDYGRAVLLKHRRLASLPSPKIVLVGGSNLSFGIDSPMIQRATGCPVANMGINGFFGSRYMFEEVRPFLRSGDMVVIAFEYDTFFKSVDGTPEDLLVVVKNNPVSFTYLTPKQRLALVSRLPFVAQRKVVRLVEEGVGAVEASIVRRSEEATTEIDIAAIESFAGFSAEGDIVSHLAVEWPYARDHDGWSDEIDSEIVGLMRDFTVDMRARGVDVMISYTPLVRRIYSRYQSTIDAVHAMIVAASPLNAPSPPAEFTFDDSMFFDTVFHLNGRGRPLRTRRLIQDIEQQFNTQGRCGDTRTVQSQQ